jgi:hypothetical protein
LAVGIAKQNGTAKNAKKANEDKSTILCKQVVGCALTLANMLGSGFPPSRRSARTRSLTSFARVALPWHNNADHPKLPAQPIGSGCLLIPNCPVLRAHH